MSLNIKNERVHALVRRASQLTGLSQTAVVEQAVERFVRDVDESDARLDDLLNRMRTELERTGGPLDIDDLYDPATGLPR